MSNREIVKNADVIREFLSIGADQLQDHAGSPVEHAALEYGQAQFLKYLDFVIENEKDEVVGISARELLTEIQEVLRKDRFAGSTGGDGVDLRGNPYFVIDGLDDTPAMRVTISHD